MTVTTVDTRPASSNHLTRVNLLHDDSRISTSSPLFSSKLFSTHLNAFRLRRNLGFRHCGVSATKQSSLECGVVSSEAGICVIGPLTIGTALDAWISCRCFTPTRGGIRNLCLHRPRLNQGVRTKVFGGRRVVFGWNLWYVKVHNEDSRRKLTQHSPLNYTM